MLENKLVQLLKSLDEKEFLAFDEFVRSPYFRAAAHVVALFDYLKKSAPGFDDAKLLKKEKIYKALFKSKKYDDNFLASIISKLLKLLEEFIAFEQFNAQETTKDLLMLSGLRKKKMEKHFRTVERQLQRHFEQNLGMGSESIYNRMKFSAEQDRFFVEQGGRVHHTALQQQSDDLDLYYLIEKLKIACDMLNRNRVSKSDYQCLMIEGIFDLANSFSGHYNNPLLNAYLLTYKLLKNRSEAAYLDLQQMLDKTGNDFGGEELKNIFDYALNFCIEKVNSGETGYFKEILFMYKAMLQNGMLIKEGYLPAWEYKNIVTAALRSGETEWAEHFIIHYKNLLEPLQQENAYTYNLSSLYYECGRYPEALTLLHNVVFVNPTYHIGAKIIQIKSFCEMQEWETAIFTLDAFAAYLRRNKAIAEYQKKSNQNFVLLCRTLVQTIQKSEWNPDEKINPLKIALKKRLENTKPLPSGDWIYKIYEKYLS